MLEHTESNTGYASFMLRLWLVWNGDHATWLASLDNTATGNSRWFPSAEALATHILAEYGNNPGNNEPAAPPDSTAAMPVQGEAG